MSDLSKAPLVIISGPSGAGKSTVLQRLREVCPLPLVFSISATTRAPRPGEQDGVHYHFLSLDEFSRRRANGEFLECMEVFGRGDWYGTLETEVTTGLRAGKCVILEIDVDGAMQVLAKRPQATTIFLHPRSLEELEARLRKRKTDDEEAIQRRLEVARHELAMKDRYNHEVINDCVNRAADEICEILTPSPTEGPS